MTKQDFFQYLNHPEDLNNQTAPVLEKVVQEYPYFQIGRMLYLKNIHNENSIEYEKTLNIVSAYSPGGKALYQLIKKKIKTTPEKDSATIVVKEEPALVPIVTTHSELTPPITILDKKDEFDELEILQNEMLRETYRTSLTIKEDIEIEAANSADKQVDKNQEHSFNDWLKIVSNQSAAEFVVKEDSTTLTPPQKSQKKDIVNKFILSEIDKLPKKNKAEFYSADVMAKRSVQDNENIVSETLASIYFKQGNLPKAQRAYEILLTKHPEKVHIFVPLLEKIKKLIEEQKAK